MRLRQDKIHDLARQILELLRRETEVTLTAGEDAVRVAVGSAILDNLEEEDEIDREVEEILRRHADEIEKGDMDLGRLRQKFKTEVARRRGFTL
jgi:hypothetical protein